MASDGRVLQSRFYRGDPVKAALQLQEALAILQRNRMIPIERHAPSGNEMAQRIRGCASKRVTRPRSESKIPPG